jgi:hypothetical protein
LTCRNIRFYGALPAMPYPVFGEKSAVARAHYTLGF